MHPTAVSVKAAADSPHPAAASCHLRLLYDLLLCYRHMEGSNATHPTAGEAGYEVPLNSAQAAAGSRLPAVCWHRVEVHKLPVTAPCLLQSSQTCFVVLFAEYSRRMLQFWQDLNTVIVRLLGLGQVHNASMLQGG